MNNLSAELILNEHNIEIPAPTAADVDSSAAINVSQVVTHLQGINNSFVLNVVNRLNRIYDFKNFIFYLSERLNVHNPSGDEFLFNFRRTFPLKPKVFLRQHSNGSRTMRDLISTPSLVMIYTTGSTDPIMEVAAQSLKGVRWFKTMFILFPRLTSADFYADLDDYARFSRLVREVLEWSWQRQFTNTLLLTIRNHVYLLEPYPTLSVVNSTLNWQARKFFKRYASNMQGYVVQSPIMYDLPRVFKGRNGQVFGNSGRLFYNFLHWVNATLHVPNENQTLKYFELSSMLELVIQGVYETMIHSFTDLTGNHSSSFSYPIGINDWCLMVPYNRQSPQETYVREALDDIVWLLLLLTAAYMSMAIWLCTPRRPRDFSAAVLQCVTCFTNSPPLSVMRIATKRMRYLYVMMFIMGIVSSNMYISKMASYMTSTPTPLQLNTMQDIIAANLRIQVQSFEYDRLVLSSQQYSQRFLQQVDVVDAQTSQLHRDRLNTSFGYFVPSDRWIFLDMQQRHLNKPRFRLTDICTGPFYHVYPMHLDSHLHSVHQEFILLVQQSGLHQYWSQEAFLEALSMHYMQYYLETNAPAPLSMSFFGTMMRTWCMGLVLAGLSFVLEMKCQLLKSYKQRFKFSFQRKLQALFNVLRRQ
ncbi:Ir56c [Drosophila busckii]|uniref:Ir56c n=1 Tax=Drosophila busckii TaxID=30019 RepID=A0A0M4EM15_DROBS|nr:uncharacterized protein LOC108594962 [Drosophila busckii]ALC42730.1 Ir56c [Drosophila busckii]